MENCKIEKVNVYVLKIRFWSINGVCYILEYCLWDKILIDLDFENVFFFFLEFGEVCEFEEINKIFVILVKDLLLLFIELIVYSL